MSKHNTEISVAFTALREGDLKVSQRLFALLYQPLHQVAERYMSGERVGHTLQPTALVHEAYLRLAESDGLLEADRAHFMRLAARVMRNVLVDHARAKQSEKRGGDLCRVTFDDQISDEGDGVEIINLDKALLKLSGNSSRMAQIVELRFFGGLTVKETAHALNVSERTVYDDWSFAKAWLKKELFGTE